MKNYKQNTIRFLIIIGECNSKTDKDRYYRQLQGSIHIMKKTLIIVSYCVGILLKNDTSIMSTYFQHKTIHKGTWTAPDSHTINKINHVIAKQYDTKRKSYERP